MSAEVSRKKISNIDPLVQLTLFTVTIVILIFLLTFFIIYYLTVLIQGGAIPYF